jgi:hypothetical protein
MPSPSLAMPKPQCLRGCRRKCSLEASRLLVRQHIVLCGTHVRSDVSLENYRFAREVLGRYGAYD